MFTIKKGQYSLEFLATYGWVLLIILITVGTLIYFDVFKIDRYLPDECIFGPNIVCQDWSVQKESTQRFDLNLKLKNNLERSIKPESFQLMNDEGTPIICNDLAVYCPYDGTVANWTAVAATTFTANPNSRWGVGMVCRLHANDCEKSVTTSVKESFRAKFGFSRDTGTNVYELNAKIMVKPT